MPDILAKFFKLAGIKTKVKTGDSFKFILGPITVQFIEMEDALFHHNSAVLMPETPTASAGDQGTAVPDSPQTSGLDVIKTTIVEVEKNPEKMVFIAGHTDTSGDLQYNVELSELRAKGTHAFLKGKRDDWVKVAEDKHKVEDYKQILKWVAKKKAFPCDPGTVNDTHDNATTTAVKRFQESYNKAFSKSIKEDGIVGKETWGAFFDVYEEQLHIILNIEPEKLQKIRDGIKFLEDGKPFVGCGESHPIEDPKRDNFRSATNRRVEILFFEKDEKPKTDCHPGPKKCKPELCRIFDNDKVLRIPIPILPTPPPGPVGISIAKIETTDPNPPSGGPAFHADDDFSPLLGEKAKIQVKVENLKDGFKGTLQLEIGRLTNRPDDAATADVNESFSLVARMEKDFEMGRDPAIVEFEWDGKATEDVAAEFSDRQTPDNNNGGKLTNIPMLAISKGKIVRHGLYLIGVATVLKDKNVVAKKLFTDVFLSVPLAVNITFNANWGSTLATYGLKPFETLLQESVRRFGGRDYMIRDGTLTNRMNARYFTDTGKSRSDTILVSIGGPDPAGGGLFGVSAFVSSAQQQNIYVMEEILNHPTLNTVKVFPITFLFFNNNDHTAGDKTTFRAAFGPVGVTTAQTDTAPGTATARSVSGGNVTGATDATDFANVTVTLDADGIATVVSKDLKKVPAARATDIQRAYNTFLRMVGNTTNHEGGHALGIAAPSNNKNQVTVSGTTLGSPLPHDGTFHNAVTSNTNIMDAGPTRSFQRRVEAGGLSQQKFSARNAKYLRDCVPFAPADR